LYVCVCVCVCVCAFMMCKDWYVCVAQVCAYEHICIRCINVGCKGYRARGGAHVCFYMCVVTHSYVCHVSAKYGIKIKSHHHLCECFLMVCSESQRMHHVLMCTPPHSLHQLYLPFLLLPAKICGHNIVCMYTRTHLLVPPHTLPHTQTDCCFVCLQTHR